MVGIVILNFNTFDDTRECIESIKKTTKCHFHIYVVDNASTDNSADELKRRYNGESNITLIFNDINGGYSFGNNIGIKAAICDGCDYILISNPDIIFYQGAIDVLLADIQNDQLIGAIGPSTRSLDQEESQLLRKTYNLKLYLFSKKPLRYFSKLNSNLRTELPYPSKADRMPFLFHGMVRGCCFIMRSEVFQQIGLFDDNVFLYSEEWIIAHKLEQLKLFCAYDNRAKVLHKEATSTQKAGTGFQSYHLYLSAFYYAKKYLKVNRAVQYLLYEQNVMNYRFKACRDKSYRKLLKPFIAASKQLLNTDKKIEMVFTKDI